MSDYINNLFVKQISSALISHYRERHLTLSLILCFEDEQVRIFYPSMTLTIIRDYIFLHYWNSQIFPAFFYDKCEQTGVSREWGCEE